MKPAPNPSAGLPGEVQGRPTGRSVAAVQPRLRLLPRGRHLPNRITSTARRADSRMTRPAHAGAQPSSEGRSPVHTQRCVPFRSGMVRYGHRLAMSPTHGSASVTEGPSAAPCGRGLLRRWDATKPVRSGISFRKGSDGEVSDRRGVSSPRTGLPRDSCARCADPRDGHSSRCRHRRAAPAVLPPRSRC
jgi:hypothetical protein